MDKDLLYSNHVTRHAIERYQERVENVPASEVWKRLSTNAIKIAIEMGASSVKLPSGHKAIISPKDGVITTVIRKEGKPKGQPYGFRDRKEEI